MKYRSLMIQCVFDELRLSLHIIPDSPITHTGCQTAVRPQRQAIEKKWNTGTGAEKASQNKKQRSILSQI